MTHSVSWGDLGTFPKGSSSAPGTSDLRPPATHVGGPAPGVRSAGRTEVHRPRAGSGPRAAWTRSTASRWRPSLRRTVGGPPRAPKTTSCRRRLLRRRPEGRRGRLRWPRPCGRRLPQAAEGRGAGPPSEPPCAAAPFRRPGLGPEGAPSTLGGSGTAGRRAGSVPRPARTGPSRLLSGER